MQAIKFKNFTDEDFTHSYDSIPYTFKAGETMFLEDYKADLFSKHLIDRELNKKKIPTNLLTERAKLSALCFPKDEPAVTPEVALDLNEKVKEAKKKGKKKVVEEEEFADLKK